MLKTFRVIMTPVEKNHFILVLPKYNFFSNIRKFFFMLNDHFTFNFISNLLLLKKFANIDWKLFKKCQVK